MYKIKNNNQLSLHAKNDQIPTHTPTHTPSNTKIQGKIQGRYQLKTKKLAKRPMINNFKNK